MTLLAALWHFDGRSADARACKAMLRAQSANHGSPVVRAEDGLVMGTSGSAEAGPIYSQSSTFALLADIRLDNRTDFLPALGLTPAEAALLSDARLLLHCFERWGTQVIDRLVGDFAILLWDRKSSRLSLARDFAGQRPLHFHEGKGFVAVSSMARGLHALDFVPRGVNETRLFELLAGLPHGDRETCFKEIQRVEPGELLTFSPGAHSARSFWNPPTSEIRLASHQDYAEALNEHLDNAVNARLRDAGGIVGTHLSAGLDSSATTASAALAFPGRVVAFTSVPPAEFPDLPVGRFGDESLLAARTAAIYPNVEHRLIATETRLPLEDLGREHWHFERPDLNLPNLQWSNRINEAALEVGITRILTASSGNTTISYGGVELLGEMLARGEMAHFVHECVAALRRGTQPRTLFAQAAKGLLPNSLVQALDRFRGRGHFPVVSGVINPSAPELASIAAKHRRTLDLMSGGSVSTRLQMMRRVDPGTYVKGALLRWNIDMLDPTADRRLMEFCLRVPLEHYHRDGVGRALIRTALKGRVPEAVRRETRRGLQSPHWFAMLSSSRDQARRLFHRVEQSSTARRLLDLKTMQRLLTDWPQKTDAYGPLVYRHGLLRGLSIGEFIRNHSGECDEPRD